MSGSNLKDYTSEEDVGIVQYATSSAGFSGILKHRYRDFQVHEIDKNNCLAKLTCLDPPMPQRSQGSAPAGPAQPIGIDTVKEAVADFQKLAGNQNAQILSDFLLSNLSQDQRGPTDASALASRPTHTLLQPVADKDARRAIHTFLKTDARLPPLLTDSVQPPASSPPTEGGNPTGRGGRGRGRGGRTLIARIRERARAAKEAEKEKSAEGSKPGDGEGDTEPVGGTSAGGDAQGKGAQQWMIRVALRSAEGGQGTNHRGEKRRRDDDRGGHWDGGSKQHVRFVLWKENQDTQSALSLLSYMLHVKPKVFGFAGTKDKRGVTSQFVTAYKVPASKIAGLNPRLWNMKLGDFEYVDESLRLGELKGNHFKIVVREVDADPEQVADHCRELTDKGFINYYGLQRFGTGHVPTHRVGAALLQGQFQSAAELILTGRPNEDHTYSKVRELYFKKKDIAGALKALPSGLVGERAVLEGLLKGGPNNFSAALRGIPRTLRMMYLHAFQSFVWNHAASHRIKTYGLQGPAVGDLVLPRGEAAEEADAEGDAGEEVVEGAGDKAAPGGRSKHLASKLAAVVVVSEQDVKEGRWSIEDVVLPLPGSMVTYPKHTTADVYKQMLEQEGISQEGGQHNVAEFSISSLTGDVRYLVHRPKDLRYRLLPYSNPNDDSITTTDLDELQGQEAQHTAKRHKGDPTELSTPAAAQPTLEEKGGEGAAGSTGGAEGAAGVTPGAEGAPGNTEGTGQAAVSTGEGEGAVGSRGEAGRGRPSGEPCTLGDAEEGGNGEAAGPGNASEGVPTAAAVSLAMVSSSAAAGSASAEQNAQAAEMGSDSSSVPTPAVPLPLPPPPPHRLTLLALELEFSLPSSCYATMLVRELTKACTSKAHHRALTHGTAGGQGKGAGGGGDGGRGGGDC